MGFVKHFYWFFTWHTISYEKYPMSYSEISRPTTFIFSSQYFFYLHFNSSQIFQASFWPVLCIFTELVTFVNSRVKLPSALISPCHSFWCKTNTNVPFVGYCDGPCRVSNSFCHCFATIYSCLICGFTFKKKSFAYQKYLDKYY